ncbi:Spherulation-specific family 4-domain-containing protein [Mycena crocata]|nr:Spherulation-specific family 4-domain-containing protein [Mycena crocata]
MILSALFTLVAFLTIFLPVHATTGVIYGSIPDSSVHLPIPFVVVGPTLLHPNQSGKRTRPANTQPNTDYQPAIQSLRSHANVLLVGYVSTQFGVRPQSEVKQDILTYAGWQTAWSVSGIFLDETKDGLTSTYTSYVNVIHGICPGTTLISQHFGTNLAEFVADVAA